MDRSIKDSDFVQIIAFLFGDNPMGDSAKIFIYLHAFEATGFDDFFLVTMGSYQV